MHWSTCHFRYKVEYLAKHAPFTRIIFVQILCICFFLDNTSSIIIPRYLTLRCGFTSQLFILMSVLPGHCFQGGLRFDSSDLEHVYKVTQSKLCSHEHISLWPNKKTKQKSGAQLIMFWCHCVWFAFDVIFNND